MVMVWNLISLIAGAAGYTRQVQNSNHIIVKFLQLVQAILQLRYTYSRTPLTRTPKENENTVRLKRVVLAYSVNNS